MKLVWPPIDDKGKCCEKGCEDMDPADPCKCECECDDIGAPIFILEKGQEQYQHPAGCKSVWYEYTKSCEYEEFDEGECTWPSLEFKHTAEQKEDIDEAQGKVDTFKAKVADLKFRVEQNPDSQGLPLALADAENKLQQAMDELASALAADKFWFHGEFVGGQGCDGYMGWYLDPETGQMMVFVKEVDPFEPDTEPHWPAAFLPVEGIEIYPGSGPYYEGIEVDRPSGSECNCEGPEEPCPEREPRFDIDLNEDGEITEDETDLCQSDDDGDGTYEYYECDPQEDCTGCMDSEASNYDANATVDDPESCCDEGCTQSTGDPCIYEAPNGKDACCCEENYNLPEWWFGEEPADAATVCYLEDPGVVCEVPDPE